MQELHLLYLKKEDGLLLISISIRVSGTRQASPGLFSTHSPHVSLPESVKQNPACKIVYLCRNPKDIFVSLWHFTNKLRPQDTGANSISEVFDLFCRGATLFGPSGSTPWNTGKLSIENPDRVLFLKFEDMKNQPGTHLRRLAEFGFPIFCW
ncbi:UNVERIFIED_CONTAM: Cytosolic sulfotransferase 12 [Sesamum latifolium]|uniref:Sulfotransferase n=1 Tax=Sesamum latifolium TaxID=2727402 RepID=A0AAW2XAI6_9LAMI